METDPPEEMSHYTGWDQFAEEQGSGQDNTPVEPNHMEDSFLRSFRDEADFTERSQYRASKRPSNCAN
jgi:hypothetical protein